MPRNVEIKAYVKDLEVVKQRILNLTSDNDDKEVVVMKQVDVFYSLPDDRAGKLKLRKIEVNRSIYLAFRSLMLSNVFKQNIISVIFLSFDN